MDVILHIGDAKCGSSAIQSSLHNAQTALLEQGILYHAPRATNGHFCYITLLGGKTRGDNTEQFYLAKGNVAETQALIRQHMPRHLILSGENLFNVTPKDLLALLHEILGEAPTSIHVVAFLRHPVQLYLSNIQQTLKASHAFPSPKTYRRDTPATFLRWRAEPRCSSLSTRLYDRKRLMGGSVVLEFQNYLRNVTGRADIELQDVDENVSLSAEQTIVLQALRQDFLTDHNNQFRPLSNRLIRFFECLNAAFGLVGTRAALKTEVKACLIDRNLPFMKALDGLFPDLQMATSADAVKAAWLDASAHWTADVESILEAHDPDIVENLKYLVPQYNTKLEQGNVTAALKALSSLGLPPRSYMLFRDYMQQSGLPEAVLAVQLARNAPSS